MEPIENAEVQSMMERIDSHVRGCVLGYALMTVMDEDDLGRGPWMQRQLVNMRNIDESFMRTFVEGVEVHGLHNRVVENAMDLGVFGSNVDMDSVVRERTAGPYSNRIKWKDITSESTCILYNGNHRFEYMRYWSEVRTAYNQRARAKDELAKNQSSGSKIAGYKQVIEDAERVIAKDGVWLVRLLDLGESRTISSTI